MLAVPSILIGRPSRNVVAWGGGKGYRLGGRGEAEGLTGEGELKGIFRYKLVLHILP